MGGYPHTKGQGTTEGRGVGGVAPSRDSLPEWDAKVFEDVTGMAGTTNPDPANKALSIEAPTAFGRLKRRLLAEGMRRAIDKLEKEKYED